MKFNANLLSILAIAGLMFLAGTTITGNYWRRQLIKQEMQAIQEKQDQILLQVEARYVDALENDEKIVQQIETAKRVLQEISAEKAITKEKRDVIERELENLDQQIQEEKTAIQKNKDQFRIQIGEASGGDSTNGN